MGGGLRFFFFGCEGSLGWSSSWDSERALSLTFLARSTYDFRVASSTDLHISDRRLRTALSKSPGCSARTAALLSCANNSEGLRKRWPGLGGVVLFSALDRGGAKPSSGVTSWGGCCGGVSLLWSARKRSSMSETPRSRSSTLGFLTISADKGASSESSLMTEFWSSPVPFAAVLLGAVSVSAMIFCVLLRRGAARFFG